MAYFEKMCRNSLISASDVPKDPPGRVIGACIEPGLKDQGYGIQA
jgi:hypothetical protein